MSKRRSRAAERKLHIFSGSVYPELAEEMAGHLDVELGDITLEKFANGETYARFMESVRGEDVTSSSRFRVTSTTLSWSCSS